MLIKNKQLITMIVMSCLIGGSLFLSTVTGSNNSGYNEKSLPAFKLDNFAERKVELQEIPQNYFSTYLGGSDSDSAKSVITDSEDAIIVTGSTKSTNFTVINALDETNNGRSDAFITKYNTSGNMLWSTYLGGSDWDEAYSVAVDSEDNIIVTGITFSEDFPVLNGFDWTLNGDFDAFVTKYNASGYMLWSTYLGGSYWDEAYSVAVDSEDNIIVTGNTNSSDFPTLNGYDITHNGYDDVFVIKFDTLGNIVWSSFLGGLGGEFGTSVAIDSLDNIIILGWTCSLEFPTLNGYDKTFNGIYDEFISKFDSSGTLIWSTYLGGSSWDEAYSVAVDSEDNIIVTGTSQSDDFPFINGYDETENGSDDGVITKFDSSGNLLWSTYLGGSDTDSCNSVTIGNQDTIIISGNTYSDDFPIMNGYDETRNGNKDAYITKFNSSGNMIWSSFLGGSYYDFAHSITTDIQDAIIVVGETASYNFPVSYGINETYKSALDAFVTKMPSILSDYDADGLTDGKELILGTNLLNSDSDADGLLDGEEVSTYKTDPLVFDTDSDGYSDGEEVIAGTDPLDIEDFPQEEDEDKESNAPLGSFLIAISSLTFIILIYRRK